MDSVESIHADTDDYGGLGYSEIEDDPNGIDGDALLEGTVERAIPGTYTVVCSLTNIEGSHACVYVPGMMSTMIGVDTCELPTEGSKILAYKGGTKTRPFFYVITVLPEVDLGYDPILEPEDAGRESSPEINPEPGADYSTVDSYGSEFEDPTVDDHLNTSTGRPWNVLAGEWVKGNKMGVYVAVMHLYSAIGAGDNARMEFSLIDDMVRLCSGTYEHNTALGQTRIFDDEGILCVESSGSMFPYERLGEDEFKEVLKFDDPEDGTYTENSVPVSAEDEIKPKDRYRFFGGALADIFQFYTRNPYAVDEAEISGDTRVHFSQDGSFNLASRTGLYFGLRARIPVPYRIADPWTPTDVDNADPQPKQPFEFDQTYKYGRNLQMREAQAWSERNMYQRFDERPGDFKVPESHEVSQPFKQTDSYESEAPENDRKDAGWEITEDGAIRFWDAWGSEIYMRGGNIYQTCPGNYEEHVGKSKVTLAGHDIVSKARNSIDLTTTKGDVRIAAGGSANIHSIGKAVKITTDSSGASVDGSGVGEDNSSRGIIIGSEKAEVAIAAKKVTLLAADSVNIKGKNVIISAINRITSVAKNILSEAGGRAALYLDKFSGSLIGPSVRILADRSVDVFRGSSVLSDIQWEEVDTPPPYDILAQSAESAHGTYYETEGWLPLEVDSLGEIKFTYRTSDQYRTSEPSEIDGSADFLIYSPAWSLESWQIAFSGVIFMEDWEEEEIEGTFPWPGAEVRDNSLVTYEPGLNVDGADLSNRENMLPSGGEFKRTSMDKYQAVT